MKQTVFTGCGTALITPFTPDTKDVDYSFFEELCRDQVARHADALIVAGTTGESPVLTKEEKAQLIRIAVSATEGRIPVIVGTGSNNTEDALRKSNDAEKEGANAVLAVTPYYNKCTQDGVIRHYRFIADRISCPLIVYNVPSRTGFRIAPETCSALAEHKNIVAVKEAGGDISAVAKTAALCGDRLTIYSGNDDQTIPIMSLGGKGVISVVSNLIPDVIHKMTIASLAGDFEQAKDIQLRYLALMNEMFVTVNPIPIKMAIELLWARPQQLRSPLFSMNESGARAMRQTLKDYRLI